MRHIPVRTIRRAVAADAAKLAQFAARTFAEAFAADNCAADMALHIAASYGARKQSLEIASPALETLLAETGEALAGYAQLRLGLAPACVAGAGPVELWRFYVDAAWHGRGVAQLLMRAVDDAARRRRAQSIWLGVWERNLRSQAFYRKCGFVAVGTQPFLLGTEQQVDNVMVRALGAPG